MSSPLVPLGDMAALVSAYRQGASFAALGERYGCSATTIRNRLMAWCQRNEVEWPLRTVKQGKPRIDSVSAELVRKEIADAVRTYRISQIQLAELAGVSVNVLHKISSGHKTTILRKTQGKVLEACSKLACGQVYIEPAPRVLLPKSVRDECQSGHPWRGQRWPNGDMKCNICTAAKHARADAARGPRSRRKDAQLT